ncbi:MAG: histidinol-phosphate transaminase [Proteobacteria bacterium]|nr:histidinol-phosphate transaminase [Pseudomonadota bacterium]
MTWVTQLARPDIVALKAYEHASWEPELERLHANELPWRSLADGSSAGLNRYPEPQPRALVQRLAALYDVPASSVLVGRGSDEAIDLLVRGFCRAGQDSVIICPPTFGMYSVSARIQGANVVTVPLQADAGFALDTQAVLEKCTPDVKLVFLCSPNNPTGNLLSEDDIVNLTRRLEGRAVVVVDEAYLEFSGAQSLARRVAELPQLAVLRTLSKAYALAGARCGTLIADPEVIALLRKVIPPYAIAQLSMEAVLNVLDPSQLAVSKARLTTIVAERDRMLAAIAKLPNVTRVWPSASNFVLVEFADVPLALARSRGARLLIRDARGYPGLGRCLRITIGSPEQNDRLLEALR